MASTHTISSLDKITAVAFNDAMPTDNTNSLDIFGAPITQKYTAMQGAQYVYRAFTVYGTSSTKTDCAAATDVALTATYANGTLGVGATLTNSGTQAALTIDGYAVAVDDRVLVWKQASASQNGIYTVTAIGSGSTNWVLTRATDYDQAAEVTLGTNVGIVGGTLFVGGLFVMYQANAVTMGTTAIYFKFIGGTVIGATSAFTITGSGIFAPIISADTTPTFPAGAYTVLASNADITVSSIVTGSVTLADTTFITPVNAVGKVMYFKAYDTDDATYRAFAALTSGVTPSMAFSQPSGGALTWDGGTIGITTPAAAKFTTITSNSLTFNTGTGVKTSQTAGNVAYLTAYDTTNSVDKVFCTFTAGTTPTMAITPPANGTISIDGTPIGNTTTALGKFTTLSATGHVTFEGVTSTGATGTGLLMFNNSPALITPALGTPASGVLTNCTGTAAGLTAGIASTANNVTGIITGTNPSSGIVGEYLSASLAVGSALSLANNVNTDIVSLAYTAGNWRIELSARIIATTMTSTAILFFGGTATGDNQTGITAFNSQNMAHPTAGASGTGGGVVSYNINSSSSGTVYLKINVALTVGTATGFGAIQMTRIS